MLGDGAYEVAFAWLVLSVSGSPATLGAVLVAAMIPRGLLLLVGGAVTDRVAARTVILATHLVRGAAVLALTALVATGAVRTWQFYVVGVVFGVAEAFFRPASAAILPSLVDRGDLPRANALVGVAEQVSLLAGPLLGGALTAWAGSAAALGVDAATFLVAAGTVLAAPQRAGGDGSRPTAGAVLAGIRSGLAYARRSVDLRVVLVIVSAATLSYSGVFAVGLPALSRQFPRGAAVLGTLVAAWGLGQLAGTVAAAVTGLPRRWGLLVIGMALAEGATFVLLGLVPRYPLAVALLVLLGFGVAYSADVALPTFVQTRTPPHLLGTVAGLIELPRATLAPVSVAVLGVLATVDLRWAFAAAALPVLVTGVGLAASPTARRLTTTPPDRPTA